jgi:MFS family permease
MKQKPHPVSETSRDLSGTLRKLPRRILRLEVWLILFLWLVYGVSINSSNLESFNLQQIGVEAIVERQQFYLEGSTVPQLQPRGDLFERGGHKYAAKQPGQFMVGAAAYFILRFAGRRYSENYLLTSALVTFLTASLLTAAAGLILFKTARALLQDPSAIFWPLMTALAYGLGSTVLAYSGIAYHDTIANSYLIFAFYGGLRLARGEEKSTKTSAVIATGTGLFLGLATTTSMTASLIAIVIATYIFSIRRWRLISFFLLGAVLGLLPLLIYDAVNFGNPFLVPNVAGGFRDTFFQLEAQNLAGKLSFYARMLAVYSPIVIVGLVGMTFYPRKFLREKILILSTLIVLVGYIANIASDGDCQYGPRYLLPMMPFACLGLAGFGYLRNLQPLAMTGSLVIGVVSLVINLPGALRGAMYCTTARHAFWPYLSAITEGETGSFPLARWLLIPLLICSFLLTWAIVANRKRRLHTHLT